MKCSRYRVKIKSFISQFYLTQSLLFDTIVVRILKHRRSTKLAAAVPNGSAFDEKKNITKSFLSNDCKKFYCVAMPLQPRPPPELNHRATLATFVGGVADGGNGASPNEQLLYPRSTLCILTTNTNTLLLCTDEHSIRVVSQDGTIRTLAGKCGISGFADSSVQRDSSDDRMTSTHPSSSVTSSPHTVQSTPALFNGPHGIALLPGASNGSGSAVVVCDINNHRQVQLWHIYSHQYY